MARKRSEHQEQTELVTRVRAFYPGEIIAAVPNGGLRDPRVAAALKAEGVLAGFPDLVLMAPRGSAPLYHGCVVEMKTVGGRCSKDQVRVLAALRRRGYFVIIGNRGVDHAFAEVEAYLALPTPTRKPFLE